MCIYMIGDSFTKQGQFKGTFIWNLFFMSNSIGKTLKNNNCFDLWSPFNASSYNQGYMNFQDQGKTAPKGKVSLLVIPQICD